MARADRIAGVLLLVLAAAYYRLADDIEVGLAADLLGPQFFPRMLAIALAIASLALVGRTFVGAGRRGAPPDMAPAEAAPDEPIGRLIGTIALTVVYLLLLPRVGYLPLTPAYLAAFALLLGYRAWLPIVGTSIGVTIALYVVFARMLGVRLPAGLLDA